MAKKVITRRQFIINSALGIAGAAASGSLIGRGIAQAAMMGGGMGGGGMGGGGGTINPPPGARLLEPPLLLNESTTPGLVVVSLEAKKSPVAINGSSATLMTYNGSFPAPTIRVRKGDTLRINFKNSLPMSDETNFLGHHRYMTNLHTHGLHVSPMGKSDNVMRMFMPGESDYYEYDLSKQEAGTLNFYHPHLHGTVAEQYWGGMAGALIVEDGSTLLSGYETRLLILKDISISGGVPEPYTSTMDYMHGKEGNTVMVNGQVNPVLPIRPGQVQRWRLLNASNARFYALSLEGHSFSVIGTEGGLLDKPYPQSKIILSPGERVDLLVKGSKTAGTYRLLSLPYSRQGMMTSPTITLMTVQNSGTPVSGAIPAVINPNARRLNMNTAGLMKHSLSLSMGQGRGYINGISFQDMNTTSKVSSMLGSYEVWEIINNSGMDHPFHQHVNAAQILSISGGDAGYAAFLTKTPAWKDTVLVPKMGKVTMLVPVMDFDGMSMFHCHIIEHEDIGMMGLWEIM